MIYKLIASVMIDQLIKRPSRRNIEKTNNNYLAHLRDCGMDNVAEAFLRSEETLSALHPEEITIRSFDGAALFGRYFPADTPSDLTFILVHGYKGSGARNFILQFDEIRSLNANILMIDQRAHGKSEGKYITFGVKERLDVASWASYLLSANENTRIILYGISMGASTVLAASALPTFKNSLCGVIADCGFTSPGDEFRHLAVFKGKRAPEDFMLEAAEVVRKKADFDVNAYHTEDFSAKLNVPVLFVHGEKDRFVPSSFTVKNFEACSSPYKKLLIVPDAYHAESFYHDPEGYKAEIRSLVKAALGPDQV